MEERKITRRPGRKLGAERRRIAREILRRFYNTDEFAYLPSEVRLAMLEFCPEQAAGAASDDRSTGIDVMREDRNTPLQLVSSWR